MKTGFNILPFGNMVLEVTHKTLYISRTGIFFEKDRLMAVNIPNGNIFDPASLGSIVRQARKSQAITQVELAALCNVGVRFVSELENGKPSLEIGKVIQVLHSLGLALHVQSRGWQPTNSKRAD